MQSMTSRYSLYDATRPTDPLLQERLSSLVEGTGRGRVASDVGQQDIAGPEQVVPICDQLSIQGIFVRQMGGVIGVDIRHVAVFACSERLT